MRSVQPPSSPRPTPVQRRPAYLVRLTLDGLDAWTSNTVIAGLGGILQGPWGKPGADISISFLGSDTTIGGKARATGFAQLYDWLNDGDVLIGKVDWQEPLVVPCVSLAAEIAKSAP
jgi:hypothetical protein